MIPKTYQITINGNISKKALSSLINGINIDNRKLKPDRVKIIKTAASFQTIEVQIHEGRKRILRRVMTYLGYEVLDLKRIKIGGLGLGDLKEGRYIVLKKGDIQKIFTPPASNNKLK